MGSRLDGLKNACFGKGWRNLRTIIPGLGGVIIDYETGAVYIDQIAQDILGLGNSKDIHIVREKIDNILHSDDVNQTIHVSKIDTEQTVFAAYIYKPVSSGMKIYKDKIASDELLEEYPHMSEAELFSSLFRENMFTYSYQPIVNAHTGDIVGYEALLRTDRSIGYTPIQILNLAEKYGRLYDIEKMTFIHNLQYISQNQMLFVNRKLYVNSIPAHFLSDDDWEEIMEKYGEFIPKVVVEMTEQSEVSEESLETIKKRIKIYNSQMAIDDFGTGYSNTSNLLRYNPMVVKIDRSLIAGIDTNQKTQKIVTSIIEFLHSSGYVALAEGVETQGEMKYLVEAGADRLQGFYIARPTENAIMDISTDIKNEIIRYNQNISSDISRVYHPKENETIDIQRLVEQKYTVLLIDTENVNLVGSSSAEPASLVIGIKENTRCTVNIKNVKLISTNSEPTIKINDGCNVILNCSGENSFERKGILVPENSSLEIIGEGNLYIKSEMRDCYAIGNDSKHSHGSIKLNMMGSLNITANGDHFIGIGSGYQIDNSMITISGGFINLEATGRAGVGIGCVSGHSDLAISNCDINIDINSAHVTHVGSVEGSVDLSIRNVYMKCCGNGIKQTGIGIMDSGDGKVLIKNSLLDVNLKGERLTFIGTNDGSLNTEIINTKAVMNGEGANITGIGDMEGAGEYHLTDMEIYCNFSSANLRDFGSRNGIFTMDNCKEI